MESAFLNDKEVQIINEFIDLMPVLMGRAMSRAMEDQEKALACGAMTERVVQLRKQAQGIFSIAAIRLSCTKSWEFMEIEAERMVEEMEKEKA